MQIPRPDGRRPWPHLYDAVVGTLREGGFIVGVFAPVHVDVDSSSRYKPVVLSMEPSSDEEIGRVLDCLAAGNIHPEMSRATAEVSLRKGLTVAMIHTPRQ